MLEKKCVLLLYSEGRYDSSVMAVREYLETKPDLYVVAHSERELYSFYRYNIGYFIYKQANRGFNSLNKCLQAVSTAYYKLKSNRSKKDIKPRRQPKNATEEFFYTLMSPYRRVHNIIARYTPDVVLCATPRLLHLAVKVKARGRFAGVSVAGLLTDYVLDSRFVNHKANYYFVQNKAVADSLIGQGIEERKITLIGTPISLSARRNYDRSETLSEFGLTEDSHNIVMVGGRYGGEVLKNAFAGLTEMELRSNILVLAGGNQGLIKFCTTITTARGYDDRVIIVEDIDDFSKIYSIANIIIAEPTSTITYEAMYHRVPLIVCRGGDRIEKRGAQYLVNNQVALHGQTKDEIVQSVTMCMDDSEFLVDFRERQADFAVEQGAEKLGDILYRIADRNYGKKLDSLTVINAADDTKLLENKSAQAAENEQKISNALENSDTEIEETVKKDEGV